MSPHVYAQVGSLAESLCTVVTLERLLVRVEHGVDLECVLLRKCLSTVVTLEGLLVPVHGAHMRRHLIRPRKAFATLVAGERLEAIVHSVHVDF